VSKRASKRLWIGVVAVSVAWIALLTVTAAVYFSGQDRVEAQAAADVRQCERGNLVRAWARWDTRLNKGSPELRTSTADRLFPILDCPETQKQRRNVPLPADRQILYIEVNVGPITNPEGTP